MEATAKKIEKAGSLKDIMRSANKPTPASSKSKIPVVSADDEMRELAQEVLDLKTQIESLTTELERAGKTLIDKAFPIRQELCKKEFTTSVKIPTRTNNLVVLVWSGNYSKIKPENESVLIDILGEDYTELFKSKFVISAEDKTDAELYELFAWLSPDGGKTEEGLKMGQERFARFFTVEEVIKPTENFIRKHVLMSDELREKLEMAGVKQYKASVKTR